ncbi:GNAT family N-acetyltransferase [Cohnella lupini]|uniref:Acetyltransferase (GNAT) family protein n=1 Tax=Cohnella lupini TaxID=1294267 RepID=A0A3D9IXJ7_9BACL|nr:GNAT family N-acetyltransferase [Cohnella lupini]RED66337.1 acetyltransferase (GNAT) family protein [Cohnella lupini]
MSNIQEQIKKNMYFSMEQVSILNPRMVMEQTPRVLRYESDLLTIPLGNQVISYQGALSADGVNDIHKLIDRYQSKKLPFSWLIWSHDVGAEDLKPVLEARGMQKVDELAGMSLSLNNWKYNAPSISGFEIKPIRTKAEMDWFRQVVPTSFGFNEEDGKAFADITESAAFSENTVFQHYIGFMDGQPATGVTALTDGENIGIYNFATLEAYRRRGLGSATIAHALREAQAAGKKHAFLQVSKIGESIYKAIGFSDEVTIEVYCGE